MELSTQSLIELLLASTQPVPRQRAARRMSESVSYAPVTRRTDSGPCACGACAKCKENARWEQIFAAKFADPEYYSARMPPHRSPLHSA